MSAVQSQGAATTGASGRDPAGTSAIAATVVVATRDRASRLQALIRSLASQRGASFELIVVDDASTDGTAELLRQGMAGVDLRTIRLERSRGPGGARNAGWRMARAPLVAFIDDDCVAEPGWLAALTAASAAEPGALVQGRTVPDPAERHNHSAWSRTQSITRLGPYFQTCNIAYPRDLLEALAGFDEAFGATGEDTDLACRAHATGAGAVFAPDARVRHAIDPLRPLDLIRTSQRWSDTVGLVKRHPHLRGEYFTHRLFWRATHERLLLALTGLALAPRTRGIALALLAPYLRVHRRRHRSYTRTVAALPAHVAIDAAEVIAMVRGSLRFRTFVL